jgi:formamidopyrimidine-DNA glycosylase
MFELPEFLTLARQINQTLPGSMVLEGHLGNSPHKFVWHNQSHEDFTSLVKGKMIGQATVKGRWLFIPTNPGYMMVIGECGGKLLYHAPGEKLPEKYHLWLAFTDGSHLTALTQMWGAYELYAQGQELQRQYIQGMLPTPIDPQFTYEYFSSLIDTLLKGEKRSVKGLLTQDQLIPGLGNAIAQDIMFRARLNPRYALEALEPTQRMALYEAITHTVQDITAQGGRYDEVDLFGRPGGYVRQMDSQAVGKPCPRCQHSIEKSQYLGGSCYFCPNCQALGVK